jgi:endonuclease III
MATQSKAQFLTDVYTLLKRRYKLKGDRNASRLSVLKAVVYGICHEDTSREHANQALSRFKDEFFDWNEVRVSSLDEIQESLAGIPEPEERARRIRRFLRQLFNRTYGFNLDALTKKPLKEALKVLQTYDAFASDYVTATVIQQALGGHAIPIDKHTHRALERLGIHESTIPELRAVLERAVPKNRGAEFLDLLEDLAYDTCVDGEPDCPRCELRKICLFVQARKQEPAAPDSANPARPAKPRPSKEKDAARTPQAKPADAASPPAPAPAPSPVKKSTTARAVAKEPTPPAKQARGKPGAK